MNRKIRRTIIGALRNAVYDAIETKPLALNNFIAYMSMVESSHQEETAEQVKYAIEEKTMLLRQQDNTIEVLEATVHRQRLECDEYNARLHKAMAQIQDLTSKVNNQEHMNEKLNYSLNSYSELEKRLHDARMTYAQMSHISVQCYHQSATLVKYYAMPVAIYNEIREFAAAGNLVMAVKTLKNEILHDLMSCKATVEQMEWVKYVRRPGHVNIVK